MNSILIASFDRFDFPSISHAFSALIEKGYAPQVLGSIQNPLEPHQAGAEFHPAPRLVVSREEGWVAAFRRSALGRLAELSAKLAPDIETLDHFFGDWGDRYLEFCDGFLREIDPVLTIICVGEIETLLMAKACRRNKRKYAFFLPPFYEFKFTQPFFGVEKHSPCLVAGRFGVSRLANLGVARSHIFPIGCALGEKALRSKEKRSDRGRRKSLLYCLQGLPENLPLFSHLLKYQRERPEVHLWLRPHPQSPLTPEYATPVDLRQRIQIRAEEPLHGLLAEASVLVALSSITILEALVLETPVVGWKGGPGPEEAPFFRERAALQTGDYDGLREALDALLFDENFRERWLNERKETYRDYFEFDDEGMPERMVKAVNLILEQNVQPF